MKILVVVFGLAAAAAVATYARYESLHPCAWLEQDMARALGLPLLMAQARIRASFLFRGIAEPSDYDCLTDWWRLKAEGRLPKQP